MATIRQKDAPSLLMNGDFNSGLSGWEVLRGSASHGINSIAGSTSELSLQNTGSPLYVAKLVRPAEVGVDHYSEIAQTVDRKDVWSYPSEHYVVNAIAVPTSPSTIRIEFPADTIIDGKHVASEEFAVYQMNGFGERIPISEGSELLAEVPQYPDLNGVFRAGATVKYTASNIDRYFLTASPTKSIPWIASHQNAAASFVSEGQHTFIVINKANTFNRQIKDENNSELVGIQPGDTLVIENIEERAGVLFSQTSGLRRRTDYSVCKITSIQNQEGSVKLGVSAIPGSPFIPAGLPNISLTTWYVFPRFRVNFVKYVYAYRYEFTLAFSAYPANVLSNAFDSFLIEPFIDIVDPVTGEETPILINNTTVPLPGASNSTATAFGESASTSEESSLTTTFRRHVFRFLTEFTTPPKGNLRVRIRYQPLNTSSTEYPPTFEIGDVVLYKGDFVARHDFSYLDDRSDTSVALPADQRSSLDRLLHKVDEHAGVIPKGAVILYSGPRCPAGFKRVDSLAKSATDGIWSSTRQASSGELETVPLLPPPEGASYDGIRNRTVLTWTGIPAVLLDQNNRPIPVKGVSKQVLMSTPATTPTFGEMELFNIDTPQLKVQPGMSLRIRSSRDRGIHDLRNRKYDYSSVVRQVSVSRQHFEGVWASDNPAYDGISYPMFIPFSALPPSSATVPPLGPIFVTTASLPNASNNQSATSLTIGNINQTETTQTVSKITRVVNGPPSSLETLYTTLPYGTNLTPFYSIFPGFPFNGGVPNWSPGDFGQLPPNGVYGNPVPVTLNDGLALVGLPNVEFDPIPNIGDLFALTLMYRIPKSTLDSRGISYNTLPVPIKALVNQTLPNPTGGSTTTQYVYLMQRLLVEINSANATSVSVRKAGGGTIDSYVGSAGGPAPDGFVLSGVPSEISSAFNSLVTSLNWARLPGDPVGDSQDAWAYLSDAKLFDPNSVVINKSVIRGQGMWSVRAFTTVLNVSVFGNVVDDIMSNNFEGVVVEPSGYVRYGDTVVDDLYPDGRLKGFSYGSMGHSHEITQGNATFNENIAPRVATYKESEVAPTSVARKHGHGFFPKYFYPMPEFSAYLMCEKV
jgi:hypothetical protein